MVEAATHIKKVQTLTSLLNAEELAGTPVLPWEHLVQDLSGHCPESASQEVISLSNLKRVRGNPYLYRHNTALNPSKDELSFELTALAEISYKFLILDVTAR